MSDIAVSLTPPSRPPAAVLAGAVGVVVLVALASTTQGFLSVDNVKAIATSAALVGIVAAGMTFILVSGNLFSLSLGVTAAVTAMVFLATLPLGLVPAIACATGAGTVICALQGYAVGAWGANPIVVTIGAGAVQQGVAVWWTGGRTVLPDPTAASFDVLVEPVLGVPFVVYAFAAVVVVCELLLRTTRFGREITLLGTSARAARAAALRVPLLVTGVFAIAGACAGLCGVLLGAQSGRGELLLQGTLTFDALAAVLVGGSAIAGGHGAVWRSAVGALVIATVTDLLLLRGYSTGVQLAVKGLVVVAVVVLVHVTRRTR